MGDGTKGGAGAADPPGLAGNGGGGGGGLQMKKGWSNTPTHTHSVCFASPIMMRMALREGRGQGELHFGHS